MNKKNLTPEEAIATIESLQGIQQPSKSTSSFKKYLISAVSTSIILIFINLITSPHSRWAIWPIGGISIGLLAKGLKILFPDDDTLDAK